MDAMVGETVHGCDSGCDGGTGIADVRIVVIPSLGKCWAARVLVVSGPETSMEFQVNHFIYKNCNIITDKLAIYIFPSHSSLSDLTDSSNPTYVKVTT